MVYHGFVTILAAVLQRPFRMIIEEPTASYRVCDVWMQTLGKTNLFPRSSTIAPLALSIPIKTDKLFFYSGKN